MSYHVRPMWHFDNLLVVVVKKRQQHAINASLFRSAESANPMTVKPKNTSNQVS